MNTKINGLRVTTGVKSGGLTSNHTRGALKVRTAVKAGGMKTINHTRGALAVRAGVKAGGLTMNHTRAFRRV